MQTVVTPIQVASTSDTRLLKIAVQASWLKVQDLGVVYAIVGTSLVNGSSLVQGDSAVITNADLFDYMNESEYAMQFDCDRRLREPQGGISYAIANLTLDNITDRFTPNKNATIGTALEARRPFKIKLGFTAEGVDRLVQKIVGLSSSRPKINETNKTVQIEIYDYITFIEKATVEAATYEDMRTDEIIEDILQDLGFGSSQYDLDIGINTITFAWFDKDKSAGRRIRDLCEAEEGHFYQDENGVLRFENRNHYSEYPHQNVQMTIDSGDILTDDGDDSTRIINRAIVIAKPRTVDALATAVWALGDTPSIAPGATLTVWAAFYDDQGGQNKLPVKEITTPASTTDYIGNTAADGSGSDRTASLAVVATNFVESAKVEITNNHGSDTVFLTLLQLRGKAARVTQAIQAVQEDADSINKFEAQEYTVENDLIQTRTLAETIAENLVNKYKDPLSRRIIRIPGIPHLQLKDLLYVMNPHPENLIDNPSLEVNTDGWAVESDGAIGATLSRVSGEIGVPDGAWVGKITAT